MCVSVPELKPEAEGGPRETRRKCRDRVCRLHAQRITQGNVSKQLNKEGSNSPRYVVLQVPKWSSLLFFVAESG